MKVLGYFSNGFSSLPDKIPLRKVFSEHFAVIEAY